MGAISGIGTIFRWWNPSAGPAAFIVLAAVKAIVGPSMTRDTIDTTTLDNVDAATDKNVSSCVNDDYTTFGSASADGFTATSNGTDVHEAGTADEIPFKLGSFVRIDFDQVLNSGAAPKVMLADALGGTLRSPLVQSVAGANSIILFPTAAGIGVVQFQNDNLAGDFVISNLSVTTVEGYRTFIASLRDSGTVTLNLLFSSANYTIMLNEFETETEGTYQIILSDGVTTDTLEFTGYVSEMPTNIPVDDVIMIDVTIKVSGSVVLTTVP